MNLVHGAADRRLGDVRYTPVARLYMARTLCESRRMDSFETSDFQNRQIAEINAFVETHDAAIRHRIRRHPLRRRGRSAESATGPVCNKALPWQKPVELLQF